MDFFADLLFNFLYEVPWFLHDVNIVWAIVRFGNRIWAGMVVTANPADFKCLSPQLRFCGLIEDVLENGRYSGHTRMLYHMLADQVVRQVGLHTQGNI